MGGGVGGGEQALIQCKCLNLSVDLMRLLKGKPKDSIIPRSQKTKLPFITQMNYQNEGSQDHLITKITHQIPM